VNQAAPQGTTVVRHGTAHEPATILMQGVVLRLEAPAAPGGTPTAVVQMTDFYEPNSCTRKLKVPLPVTTVQPFVQAKQPSGDSSS